MAKKEQDLYKVNRFSVEQLQMLHANVAGYAEGIDGLPHNATEALSKRGWITPYLLAYDDLLWGRWSYWFDLLQKGTIEGSKPIPQITWFDRGEAGVRAAQSMLAKCLDHYESNIDRFADWLLWAHGGIHEAPRISESLNAHYYRYFDLFLILDNPTDYLSEVLCNETGKGYKGGLGYYPTPFNLTLAMTQMVVGDPEQMKRQTVHDPCVGCGAMLLPMSNYSLRAYSQDISLIAIKLCRIQFYWFAPWYAIPGKELLGFQDESGELLPVDLKPSEKPLATVR